MIDDVLLLAPVVLLVVVLLLSFVGCTLLVGREDYRFHSDLRLAFDARGKAPVKRVVFFIERPTLLHVTAPVLIQPDTLIKDEHPLGVFSDNPDFPSDHVDVVANSGKFSVRITNTWAGAPHLDEIVWCRAFADEVKDDVVYPETADLVENRGGTGATGAPFEFTFTLSDTAPFQVVPQPQGIQTTRARPVVFLEFDRGTEPGQILKVLFRITVVMKVGSFSPSYEIAEGISDLETHATHEPDAAWKTLAAVTGDETGSNATGKYRMSIRNAPVGDWSVTCEGYDSAKPAKTVTPQFPPGPNPASPMVAKGTIERWPAQPTTFKFKLVKSGIGVGKVIVPI